MKSFISDDKKKMIEGWKQKSVLNVFFSPPKQK